MTDSAGITRRNGLKVDLAAQAAWQRESAKRYAAKQRARKNIARMSSTITRRPARHNGNDWPPAVRKLAARRSGGLCEVCQSEAAVHLHHRKSRRHRDHRIVNALHVCGRCHGDIHAGDRRAAHRNGYLVQSKADPASLAVLVAGERLLPTADGEWVLAA